MMNAWKDVLRLELRRARRDRSLLGLLLLFALIAGYAAWSGSQWMAARQGAQALVAQDVAETRERFLSRLRNAERRGSQPGVASGMPMGLLYGPVLPLDPLTSLSLGQADSYPYAAKLHALRPAHAIFEAGTTLENPATLAAGRFDLAFVIVFLLPLLLLAGAYDIWTQERDAGTADFILSQPQRPGAVIAMKLIARSGLMLLALTLITMIALAASSAQHGIDVRDMAEATAVVLLYGLFWMLVAVAVNLRARHSAQAAIACGGIWLGLLIFAPAILAAVKDLAAPRPSHAQYVNDLRAIELKLREAEHQQAPSMQNTATSAPQNRKNDPLTYLIRAREEDEQFAVVTNDYHVRIVEHVRLGNALRLLVPSVVTQDALDRIAGTHADRALSFQRQAVEFLEHLRRFASEYRATDRTLSIDDHYRNMPEFRFDERADDAGRATPLIADLGALLSFNLILLAIIGVGLRRRWLHGNDKGDGR